MHKAGAVGRVQAVGGLREQAIADAGGGGERRPVGRAQAGQPLLQHRGPAVDLEHLQRRGQVRVVQHRLAEALAELVGTDRVVHRRLSQMPQQRLDPAARVEDAVHCFQRRRAHAIDDAHRAEHQAIDVTRLDQRELVKRDGAAGQQHLPQRTPLPPRFGEQRGQGIVVHELQGTQRFAETLVARIDGARHRQDAAARRNQRIVVAGSVAVSLRETVCVGRSVGLFVSRSERTTIQWNAGQIAQLAAVPFAHVGQVAIHFLATVAHLALLLLKRLGLARQAFGRGVDLLDLFRDLHLAPLQPRFIAREHALHVADLALPVDELLAEAGHREPVLVLALAQRLLLLLQAIHVKLHPATQALQLVLALLDVLVHLGEVIAELFAGMAEPIQAGADAQLDLGELFEQPGCLTPQRFELGAFPAEPFQRLLLIVAKARLLVVQRPRQRGKLFALGAVFLPFGGQGGFLLPQGFGTLAQLVLQRREPSGGLGMFLLHQGVALIEAGRRRPVRLDLLVDAFLPLGQLLSPAAQLLLQRLARLLRLGQGDGAVAQGLPFRVQPLLRLGELRQPALQHAVLLDELGRLRF